jgi:hypothetical protein
MTSTNAHDDNIMLVINYIDKHYIFYNINTDNILLERFPMSHDYSIKEIAFRRIDPWVFEEQIVKIFSIETSMVKEIIKKIIFRNINSLLDKQLQFDL